MCGRGLGGQAAGQGLIQAACIDLVVHCLRPCHHHDLHIHEVAAPHEVGQSLLSNSAASEDSLPDCPTVDLRSTAADKCNACHLQIEEELEDYKKSGDKYLGKVDFLKRAELREYEKERDQRLGSNMRNRGRL